MSGTLVTGFLPEGVHDLRFMDVSICVPNGSTAFFASTNISDQLIEDAYISDEELTEFIVNDLAMTARSLVRMRIEHIRNGGV